MKNSAQTENASVAVIGATGYIGARLVPQLIDAGWHVRAIGRNPEKPSTDIKFSLSKDLAQNILIDE